MRRSNVSKVFALVLALAMLLSMVPATVFAAEYKQTITTASTVTSALAPGVTEQEVVAYDKNGDRIVYYVVNADIATNPDVQVKANYHDNDNSGNWGKATIVEQANAATAKRGYNVVATTNGAYYNVSTGQPTGAFVMEGVNLNGNGAGDSYPFFAIMKDGTAMIGKKGTFSKYADQVQEAVGGWSMLIWDGKICDGLNAVSKYPRCTVGIKADGNVVLMLADGNQKPYSAGLTYAEQAEIMFAQGCIAAVELDGGGSATYAAKLEGTDEVAVRNSCCDGTVRSVSNSIMVISTAVADGTFDHANLSTEYAYYAACSTVNVDAVGADKAGGPADLPELTWSLSDDSFGTVADGKFVSNGKIGTVTVNALYDGQVVGSEDVTIVHPTEIAFSANEKTVPYGKTSDFTITALYNGAATYIQPDAFEFVVGAGSMDGFIYTAPAEDSGVTTASVTATYKYAELAPITVVVTYGKGSEILFNFEDANISEWTNYDGMVEAEKNGTYTNGYTKVKEGVGGNSIEPGMRDGIFLASRENGGKVYSGDYSLGFTIDYTQHQSFANWLYDYLYYLGDTITYRDVEKGINGTRLGMWMYIPEEAVGLCARLAYTYIDDAKGTLNTAYLYFTYQYVEKGFSKLTSAKIPEAGWAYVYCDLDAISKSYVTSSYYKTEDGTLTREVNSNYAPAFIQFIVSSSATGAEKCTLYIDDITLDYSDVVDDRDAPLVKNPVALDDQNTYAMGSTLNFNNVSFTADVSEDTSHGTNYTGLDATTAQIYIDGHKVPTTFSAGKIATAGAVLPNGVHDVTFEIADKQGNYTKLTKQITIAAETEYPVITVTGAAPAVKPDGKLYTGSQYNLMINTDKVEAIDTITTKIWLNSASKWALEHMTALSGFEATYVLDELACTAEITVTRIDDVSVTGAATLVTIPVYAWAWDGSTGWDSTYQWNTKGCAPQITVSYKVKYGEVIYTDDFAVEDAKYIPGFGNVRQDVKTELDTSIANLKPTIGIWHSHTPEAVADLAPDCNTEGYEGRTACSVCKSIVDWGKDVPATGHSFASVDGVMKCACGEFLNGEYEGKFYVDGILVEGWIGDSYYAGGVMLKGIQLVDGFYYDFGENGICEGQNKYTGLVSIDGVNHYAIAGSLKSGWHTIDGEWYYFGSDFKAYDGLVSAGKCGVAGNTFKYEFDNGKLVSGVWLKNSVLGNKYFYGPGYYKKGFEVVDGVTYYFNQYGYTLKGNQVFKLDPWSDARAYSFDENGALLLEYTDTRLLTTEEGKLYYLVNGEIQRGLQYCEGEYYYFKHPDAFAVSGEYYVGSAYTNDLVKPNYYEFGEDGKMLNGIVNKDGSYYYYTMGRKNDAGAIEVDGIVYFAGADGKLAVGRTYVGTSAANGILAPGNYYEFGADGSLLNGVVEKEDGLYYYTQGKSTKAGVVCTEDGIYYFGTTDGKCAVGEQYVSSSLANDILKAGTYEFGTDGKLLNGFVTKEDGIFYYENGRTVKTNVVLMDGETYYITAGGKVMTGVQYVGTSASNGILAPGYYYEFGADGKLLNGFATKEDGIYYYVNGKTVKTNVAEINGEIYYIIAGGKVMTGVQYVGTSASNGILAPGYYYEFGADGKLLNGFATKEDGIYYYVNGKTVKTNVAEINGEIYYITAGGKVMTGVQYIGTSASNGILAPGYYYEFGEDGRLLDGIEAKEDGVYYYTMGKASKMNVIVIDGATYFIVENGKAVTGEKYVGSSQSNGILAPGYYYEFGADGKLLDGFVEKEDGIYYYRNGRATKLNMIELDGNYYYISDGGKVMTGVQNVSSGATNGILSAGNYLFAEDGKLLAYVG